MTLSPFKNISACKKITQNYFIAFFLKKNSKTSKSSATILYFFLQFLNNNFLFCKRVYYKLIIFNTQSYPWEKNLQYTARTFYLGKTIMRKDLCVIQKKKLPINLTSNSRDLNVLNRKLSALCSFRLCKTKKSVFFKIYHACLLVFDKH